MPTALEAASRLVNNATVTDALPQTRAELVPHIERCVFHLFARAGHGTALATGNFVDGPRDLADAIGGCGALPPHTVDAGLLSFAAGAGAREWRVSRPTLDAVLVYLAVAIVVDLITTGLPLQNGGGIAPAPVAV